MKDLQILAFKMDYKIVDGHVVPIELGHSHSNSTGMPAVYTNLLRRLRKRYRRVLLTGSSDEYYTIKSQARTVGFEQDFPEYISPNDETLRLMASDDGILVVRNIESPSHFTPVKIKRLLARQPQHKLEVFDALPTLSLAVYEKILFHRIQTLCGFKSVPTALLDLRRNFREQLDQQDFKLESKYYVIKPAFASGGKNFLVVTRDELLRRLDAVKDKLKIQETMKYQRALYSCLDLMYGGPKDKFEKFFSLAGLEFLVEREKNVGEDPYCIVQALVNGDLLLKDDRWFDPTYRAFFFVEHNTKTNQLSMSLLARPIILFPKLPKMPGAPVYLAEKICANLGSDPNPKQVNETHIELLRRFFQDDAWGEVLRYVSNVPVDRCLSELQSRFPELKPFCRDCIDPYPPYQLFLTDALETNKVSETFYTALALHRLAIFPGGKFGLLHPELKTFDIQIHVASDLWRYYKLILATERRTFPQGLEEDVMYTTMFFQHYNNLINDLEKSLTDAPKGSRVFFERRTALLRSILYAMEILVDVKLFRRSPDSKELDEYFENPDLIDMKKDIPQRYQYIRSFVIFSDRFVDALHVYFPELLSEKEIGEVCVQDCSLVTYFFDLCHRFDEDWLYCIEQQEQGFGRSMVANFRKAFCDRSAKEKYPVDTKQKPLVVEALCILSGLNFFAERDSEYVVDAIVKIESAKDEQTAKAIQGYLGYGLFYEAEQKKYFVVPAVNTSSEAGESMTNRIYKLIKRPCCKSVQFFRPLEEAGNQPDYRNGEEKTSVLGGRYKLA